MKYCSKCGAELENDAKFCYVCGEKCKTSQVTNPFVNENSTNNNASNPIVNESTTNINASTSNVSDKSRAAAAILAFFLGGLGIHNFYLGRTKQGVIQLVLFLFCWLYIPAIIVGIWAIVDFVLILCGNVIDGNGKIVSKW